MSTQLLDNGPKVKLLVLASCLARFTTRSHAQGSGTPRHSVLAAIEPGLHLLLVFLLPPVHRLAQAALSVETRLP